MFRNEQYSRPIDDPALKPLFEAKRKQVQEEELLNAEELDLNGFLKKARSCIKKGGTVNLVGTGGLVESARSIGGVNKQGLLSWSDQERQSRLIRAFETEFLLGASLYDRSGRPIGNLVIKKGE